MLSRVGPATGHLFEPGYSHRRGAGLHEWGKVLLSRENLLPFLYKLHYSTHIPDGWGIEFGMWFMGLLGIAWVLDTLVALWISFPSLAAWRRSFAFRWGHKLNFDLHRSGAMWVYPLVLILAVTSVSMNLRDEVMLPIVSWFSELSPSPFTSGAAAPPERPIEPVLSVAHAIEIATADAWHHGVAR